MIRMHFKNGYAASIDRGVWWSSSVEFAQLLKSEDDFWRKHGTAPVIDFDPDKTSAKHAMEVFDGWITDITGHKPPKLHTGRIY